MKIENCWYKEVCKLECNSSCIRFLEMEYLVENSGVPDRTNIRLEPEDIDYEKFCLLNDYKSTIIDHVTDGDNIYIASKNTGNGKTSWAIKLLLKYFDEIWAGNGFRVRGLFIHVPTLLMKLKDFNNPLEEEYKRNIMECDLVVWDDIASSDLSNYDLTQLLIYLDNRLVNNKANIYTGNITDSGQLEKVLGNRLASRIWNKSSIIILHGKDRRS